ncbi:TetR/AcrR family transcriptional regulator [Kitasatospora sp. NBC_01287]|uniref:TetR/AcrR family transcriptional regulator n=1 Tax=Kitasatospora sp. NBC_01287 TaxID=2903573 RepID=UPI002252E69B|nr:TetR/AcrR family transcriptional regulator [Kitasatospora sp. NBC_01287]MCX4751058.1 TetR/AcrR family transcriptional regulator [Kitasatospora sp. NBC_01287]
MNRERRDQLRDAAIEVLAEAGGRGLTHRAVDAVAGVPLGTAKNYFPTRDALLGAAAERCEEQYRAVAARLGAAGAGPGDREGLVAVLRGLLENVAGPGRPRMLAYLELRAEAGRRSWLSAILDPIAAADFAGFEWAQRAAGLPVTPRRAATVTLALHAAIPHLLDAGPATLAAAGLDDLDRFVRGLLDAVYPQGPGDAA